MQYFFFRKTERFTNWKKKMTGGGRRWWQEWSLKLMLQTLLLLLLAGTGTAEALTPQAQSKQFPPQNSKKYMAASEGKK